MYGQLWNTWLHIFLNQYYVITLGVEEDPHPTLLLMLMLVDLVNWHTTVS